MPGFVYKVCRQDDWIEAKRTRFFNGSPDDARDGFIHLSTFDQLAGTLARHFSDRNGKAMAGLVLVAFEPASLGAALKWEPSRDGSLFPHLYGPLETRLAIREKPLEVDANGRHVLGDAGGC